LPVFTYPQVIDPRATICVGFTVIAGAFFDAADASRVAEKVTSNRPAEMRHAVRETFRKLGTNVTVIQWVSTRLPTRTALVVVQGLVPVCGLLLGTPLKNN
jgi:hypothetical protein